MVLIPTGESFKNKGAFKENWDLNIQKHNKRGLWADGTGRVCKTMKVRKVLGMLYNIHNPVSLEFQAFVID